MRTFRALLLTAGIGYLITWALLGVFASGYVGGGGEGFGFFLGAVVAASLRFGVSAIAIDLVKKARPAAAGAVPVIAGSLCVLGWWQLADGDQFDGPFVVMFLPMLLEVATGLALVGYAAIRPQPRAPA